MERILSIRKKVAIGCAFVLGLYQIYTAIFGIPTVYLHRTIHLGAMLVICFLLIKPSEKHPKLAKVQLVLYTLCALVSLAYLLYGSINSWDTQMREGSPTLWDKVFCLVLFVLVFYATYKRAGPAITIIAAVFMVYLLFGQYLKGSLRHAPVGARMIYAEFFNSTGGILGSCIGIASTQYICVNADRVIRFADDVDVKVAALVEPLTVGVHDVRRSGLRLGETVLIGGAGPIGLIIAMTAQFAGASGVVLSEIDPVRIKMARDLGFTVANPMEPEEFDAVCSAVTEGRGFDRAFEITSVQSSFTNLLLHLKKGGVLVQVGMPPKGTQFKVDLDKLIYSECEVRGVRHHTMNDMQQAARIINSGVMNETLRHLVTAEYPLEQCMDAFMRAKNDKTMLRVLIKFEED